MIKLGILKGARPKPNRSKIKPLGSSEPSTTGHNRSEQKEPDGSKSEQKTAVAAAMTTAGVKMWDDRSVGKALL